MPRPRVVREPTPISPSSMSRTTCQMRLRTQGSASSSAFDPQVQQAGGEGLGLEQQGVACPSANAVDTHVGADREGVRDVFDVGVAERELGLLTLVAEDTAGHAGPASRLDPGRRPARRTGTG